MKRFIEGNERSQATLLPQYLDDYIAEDNPVRAVDAFVEELDLKALGFEGADPAITGRPSYHPAVLLKIYIYGYLNRIASSRRLEREAQRNVEVMWLTEQLSQTDPDARSMISQAKGTGVVGYNVQAAVDARHHLIVAHQVTNVGTDRAALTKMAIAARQAMNKRRLQALADRGYYNAREIKACTEAGITPLVCRIASKSDPAVASNSDPPRMSRDRLRWPIGVGCVPPSLSALCCA
jgi:transposase